MKYSEKCTNIIDVTKPPYCADNTGKIDCTDILRKVIDDVLIRLVEETEKFAKDLWQMSEEGKYDVCVGFEAGKVTNGQIRITHPYFHPTTKIIYFPAGTYLVSDTVTYTLTNLKNKYYVCPDYELNRHIHILGESRENTVIKLVDNADGFGIGSEKPLFSFNTNRTPRNVEVSNTSQMNMLEDITIDMGKGNGGVGVRYHSSNSGRIENVTIKAECGTAGIYTMFGSEASFNNIEISGFDYGMDIGYSQVITVDNTDVSKNRIAGIITDNSSLNVVSLESGDITGVVFREGSGIYYIADEKITAGDYEGNYVYREESTIVERPKIPQNPYKDLADCAFVDDFGAIADGKTDSARAIRKAFASGKSVILFGEGEYYVNESIEIPETVKYIDFNFCGFVSGPCLIGGEAECVFDIAEESDDILFLENYISADRFYGHFRMFKQSCVRDVVMSDLQPTMASLYFNTVGGSKIYFDNVFVTTGTYTQNRVLQRKGLYPVYSKNIPFEFHGQKVYGKCVNPERADIALLNDASEVLLDGYRTEGPGTAAKTVNGGKTVINVFEAGIGTKTSDVPLFESYDSQTALTNVKAYGYDKGSEYNILVKDGDVQITWDDTEEKPAHYTAVLGRYENKNF